MSLAIVRWSMDDGEAAVYGEDRTIYKKEPKPEFAVTRECATDTPRLCLVRRGMCVVDILKHHQTERPPSGREPSDTPWEAKYQFSHHGFRDGKPAYALLLLLYIYILVSLYV